MSATDELRAEVIALRLLVIRGLRAEFDAQSRDPAWESTLKLDLVKEISLLKPRGTEEAAKIKSVGLDIITEALFGPRPPAQ